MSAGPPRKVLATWHPTEKELAEIVAAAGPGAEVLTPDGPPGLSRYECTLGSIASHLPEAEAIVGWVVPRGALALATNLRLLAWLHAGVDELDLAELGRRGVVVCNVRGANAPAVAEHAVALTLALAKRVPVKHRAVVEGLRVPLWEPGHQGAMLAKATATIVGLGQVGAGIARRLQGFEMRLIGIRRDPTAGGGPVDEVRGPDGFRDALAESDFVILAVPITAATQGLLGAAEFAVMKRGALLINVARGNIVDEAALATALESGQVGGYGCDVWWNYTESFPATYHFPSPSRTGLHRSDAVVASGDQANNAAGVRERDIEFGLRSLRQFGAGERPELAIDLERGY
jgi:phosphoglycerate dehydrogenase-like enzyme